jgi:hypothetical protein
MIGRFANLAGNNAIRMDKARTGIGEALGKPVQKHSPAGSKCARTRDCNIAAVDSRLNLGQRRRAGSAGPIELGVGRLAKRIATKYWLRLTHQAPHRQRAGS